jgi:hypothetical protein
MVSGGNELLMEVRLTQLKEHLTDCLAGLLKEHLGSVPVNQKEAAASIVNDIDAFIHARVQFLVPESKAEPITFQEPLANTPLPKVRPYAFRSGQEDDERIKELEEALEPFKEIWEHHLEGTRLPIDYESLERAYNVLQSKGKEEHK